MNSSQLIPVPVLEKRDADDAPANPPFGVANEENVADIQDLISLGFDYDLIVSSPWDWLGVAF